MRSEAVSMDSVTPPGDVDVGTPGTRTGRLARADASTVYCDADVAIAAAAARRTAPARATQAGGIVVATR